ncbi:MAG: aldehyde dehydrogenase family protein [Alphaproteobacteria bacterium]
MTTRTGVSPIDGSVHAERAALPLDEATNLCTAAATAQPAWASRPLGERRDLALQAITALAGMNDEIVTELAWQMGRPVRYGGEIGGVRERSDYMASIAEAALAPVMIEESAAFTRFMTREPVGTVLVVAPWNYPFLTAVNAIVPALIAGNAVVLKHSTQTLLAGERFAQAFAEAGLPAGIFQNIFADHATIQSLIQQRMFGFVNFTGSVRGGAAMERAAAGTFTGTGLELGGKDPGYVRADADLDAAVDTLLDGAMFNAGQCCCGIERIYVHESLFAPFVDRAKALVESYVLGNPLVPETTLGPMAHVRFADLVREQTAAAVAGGATALIDPARFPADTGRTAYLAPQILTNVDHTMAVMREESFGPVVGIMPVSSDEEAITLMNDSRYGLTASLWTASSQVAAEIGARLATGTVYMNRCDYLDPALCWSGCKDTGRGASLSALGYQSLTRPKSYHLKSMS